jgi:hypothetical protein
MGIQFGSATVRRRMRRLVVAAAAVGTASVVAATTASADPPNVSTTHVFAFTNNFRKVDTQGVIKIAMLPASPIVGVWTTARATAIRCAGCRSVAIDAHVVLIGGTPKYLQANNQAIAQNQFCAGCASVALSYQIVATAPGPVMLTSVGRAQLSALSSALQALASTGSPATMASSANGIVAKIVTSLNNNVVPLAQQPGGAVGAAVPTGVPASPKVTVQVFRQYHIAS